MYPGTKIQLIDNSRVSPIIADSTIPATSRPLYAAFFTSPRGPERFTILEGTEWANTYLSNNTPDFNKDGQPLLQAAMNASVGARLFSKRIVADDAILGNMTLALLVSAKDKANNTYKYYRKAKASDTEVDISDMTAEEIALLYAETTQTTVKVYYGPQAATKGEEVTPEPGADMTLYIHETTGEEPNVEDHYYVKVKDPSSHALTEDEVSALEEYELIPLYWEDQPVTVTKYYEATKGEEIEDITTIPTAEIPTLIKEATIEYDTTNKTLNIRPIFISNENTDTWSANYAGRDKDLLYTAAKEDITATVNNAATYAIDAEAEHQEKPATLMIQNPDAHQDASAEDKVAKFYTDEDASFETGVIYPIFTIFDSARSASDKLISFTPNYTISKANNKMIYSINVIDKNNTSTVLETWPVAIDPKTTDSNLKLLDPQTVVSGESYLIDVTSNYEAIDQLVADISALGFSEKLFAEFDILGRRTLGGKAFPTRSVVVDVDGVPTTYSISNATADPIPDAVQWKYESIEGQVQATSIIGKASTLTVSDTQPTVVALAFGDSGSIPDMKHAKTYYAGSASNAFYDTLNEVLTGKFTMDIYNLDLYSFDCIFDANFDNKATKDNIQKLCAYRGDCTCFMDMGFECKSLDDIREMISWDGVEAAGVPNPKYHYFKDQAVFVTDLYYDIKNPFDGRQIKVTASYSLSSRMVNHFIGGRERAFAGQSFGITIPEAILGTVNYIPKIYPLENFTSEDINMTYPSDSAAIINEKQEMCDLKVNYASYYNGILTMDTLYTTYNKDSALSYVNNIMGAQLIVKEIRKACPEITRYKFIDGNNLAKFQEDIQDRVIDKYASMFKALNFTYIEDRQYLENKIFYGAIRIAFREFTQSEYFKVTVVNGNL